MHLLVAAVQRHPRWVVVAVLVALGLVAYAMDVFVGWSELVRDRRNRRRTRQAFARLLELARRKLREARR